MEGVCEAGAGGPDGRTLLTVGLGTETLVALPAGPRCGLCLSGERGSVAVLSSVLCAVGCVCCVRPAGHPPLLSATLHSPRGPRAGLMGFAHVCDP